jgi:CheY-like chemotaxis protein
MPFFGRDDSPVKNDKSASTIDRMRTRILLVEDEATISEPLAESLGRDGFEAEVAATLAGAREAFLREAPDLVLLDVMLPDGDGRDLAREIRKESDVPIVMLMARGEEIDRVLGLELGADDYVVKPFSSRSSRLGSEPSCDAAALEIRRARSRSERSVSTPPRAPSPRTTNSSRWRLASSTCCTS